MLARLKKSRRIFLDHPSTGQQRRSTGLYQGRTLDFRDWLSRIHLNAGYDRLMGDGDAASAHATHPNLKDWGHDRQPQIHGFMVLHIISCAIPHCA
jgi:hypothetical protein